MTIRQLRKSTGLSQSKFSAYFGIPTATLQDWEHERRTPPTIYHWYDGTDFRTGKRTFRERISYGSESI